MLRHVLVGPRQHQTPVGDVGVARPDLVTVDDELVTLAGRRGGQRCEIRTRAGLRETLTPPLGAVDHAGQESLLQFLAPVMAKGDDQVPEAGARRSARLRDLLVDDDVVHRGQVLAPVLLRPRRAEKALPRKALGARRLERPSTRRRTSGTCPSVRSASRATDHGTRLPPSNHGNPMVSSSSFTGHASVAASTRRR